ncbi:MAG: CU044_2847 family protein [Cyanobacteria bacterium P01_D01_bin.1]
MSDVTRFELENEHGKPYVMYVEAAKDIELTMESDDNDEYESMGPTDTVKVKLNEIHEQLRSYAYYATGAFRDIPFVDVEEMTMKFGIKVSGSTGIPFLTKGAAEADFHIELKCKPQQQPDTPR